MTERSAKNLHAHFMNVNCFVLAKMTYYLPFHILLYTNVFLMMTEMAWEIDTSASFAFEHIHQEAKLGCRPMFISIVLSCLITLKTF